MPMPSRKSTDSSSVPPPPMSRVGETASTTTAVKPDLARAAPRSRRRRFRANMPGPPARPPRSGSGTCRSTARPSVMTHSFAARPCHVTNASRPARRQRSPQVGERRHRVVEEHQPELGSPRRRRLALGQGVGLRVSHQELDVGRATPRPPAASPPRPAAPRCRPRPHDERDGAARRTASPVPHPTSSTENPGPSVHRIEEGIGERGELAVVAIDVVDVVHRLAAVPGLGLVLVRCHRSSFPSTADRRPPRGLHRRSGP